MIQIQMASKLSRFCEGIMESAWIASIIVIPLFFNIYSSRIFEPDKIAVLRSLSLVIIAAWVVKLISEGGFRWEKIEYKKPIYRSIKNIPLLVPVIILAVVYIIATVFSINPRISFWGSYQRMQGTYTTLSYLTLFASVIANLRKRSQVDRLITVVILTSLPIGLYGILQKYGIDPVPWGGNVSNRIASNMGNSIFVAAYLIMAIPLTIGRILDSFNKIMNEENGLGKHVLRATIYIFIVAVQFIAIYMSGSRGPLLGLLAGLFFMFILLSVFWRKRWLTITTIGTAAVVGIFLILLNISNGPLEFIRQAPGVGRFGHVLDMDQRTSQVRILIWSGAAELVLPHDPIVYPDGSVDKLNILRPLIGYGPESMYVAYNQFYPPELGRVEQRNASPDRSHNETWDSLITTGFLGLLAYLVLFGTIFYYGLKWVGLIRSDNQRNLFILILIFGGVIGGLGSAIWQGIGFIGVGIPFGILIGLIAYITIVALFSKQVFLFDEFNKPYVLIIIMLLGAVVAHFAEINFGIAIVATRTHFWMYSGMLLVLGYILPQHGEITITEHEDISDKKSQVPQNLRDRKRLKRSRRNRSRTSTSFDISQPIWRRNALLGSLVLGVILVTIGYDFISNPNNLASIKKIITFSLTRLPNKNDAVSFGILALVITTWLSSAIILTSEEYKESHGNTWLKSFSIIIGGSIIVVLIFWFWHANSLAVLSAFKATNQYDVIDQIGSIGGLLNKYFIYLLTLIVGIAFFLSEDWSFRGRNSSLSIAIIPVVVILTIIGIYWTNIRIIQADIAFKMAEPFANSNQWAVATFVYKRALELTPTEDHYYLFLGKSYLEQARDVTNEQEQDALVNQAEVDLLVAQGLNPLNTDHTANLGRLYSWWAGRVNDPVIRRDRSSKASEYYARAVKLSPNNPNIWNEWAILYMDVIRDEAEGLSKLSSSLKLDNQYSWTHSLVAEYYLRLARSTSNATKKQELYEMSIEHYQKSIEVATNREIDAKIGYTISLGNLYIELGNNYPDKNLKYLNLAINAYKSAIDIDTANYDVWKIEETISRLYAQLGDKENAILHAYVALNTAPAEEKETIQILITQIQQMP